MNIDWGVQRKQEENVRESSGCDTVYTVINENILNKIFDQINKLKNRLERIELENIRLNFSVRSLNESLKNFKCKSCEKDQVEQKAQ